MATQRMDRHTNQAARLCAIAIELGIVVCQLGEFDLFVHHIQHIREDVDILHPVGILPLDFVEAFLGRVKVCQGIRYARSALPKSRAHLAYGRTPELFAT